jgi:DNA helicase-2/ATP-dependent DNA helicase PcrA
MKVARLIGGAGTGKTTELLTIMKSILPEVGGDPQAIGFASLTKAAREEMVSRASDAFDCHPSLLEGSGWFRTAHSTCHKMLDIKGDQLLAGDDKASRWVADRLKVSVSWRKVDDSGYRVCVGDDEAAAALTLWDVARNRVEPLEAIHREKSMAGIEVPAFGTVKYFVRKYEDSKRLDGKCDFVDILGRYAGIRFALDGPEAAEPEGPTPAGVQAWIFDEAQDSSKLLDSVCRRLAYAPGVRWAYLAADPFQSVFGFGGADYNNFMAWQADKERTMPQSWRCPAAVMELGERCLRRMRKGYFDRKISPASHDGRVVNEPSIERAISQVDGSRTTLVLARCKYSLSKFAEMLESRKIPHAYINEKSDTKAMTAYNAYWSLQHGRGISGQAWEAAIGMTPTKAIDSAVLLRHGEKTAWTSGRRQSIDFLAADEVTSLGGATPELAQMIHEGRWSGLLDGGGKWYAAAKRHGAEVATKPNVRLSTIHGAKGMEAQDVILSTETAARVERERELDPRVHDEECRIEYVGVTRAKERLIVCESDEPYAMELPL